MNQLIDISKFLNIAWRPAIDVDKAITKKLVLKRTYTYK